MNIFNKYTNLILIYFTLFAFSATAQNPPKIIHAFVALCDNQYQGIVSVPETLGNGDDPKNNLYWGALYGVKSFFQRSSHWKLIKTLQLSPPILERCIFKHQRENIYLVADAYRGKEIKQTVIDFLNAASGNSTGHIAVKIGAQAVDLAINGKSDLIVYVGHDGLMDFNLKTYPAKQDNLIRETIILACVSKTYFKDALISAGAKPLLWTTGLLAPEAYILENAFEGWILKEGDEKIRLRAASAYSKYQKCSLKAAKRLFATGM